jgi:hypothetical protein
MNNYKIGSFVNVKVSEIDGRKRIVRNSFEDNFEIKSFKIIAKYFLHKESAPLYMVLIDPGMIGWTISESHALYYDLDSSLLKEKFFDVNEEFIID